jgi:single-strand DNA-binding protein
MSSLTNRVSLIGFLGKDAEVKTTRNNARFTVLSLATKRSWKDRETGEWQSKSTWHRIICWGRLAEYAAEFTKGSHLQVEGEITTREYVHKTGGARPGGFARQPGVPGRGAGHDPARRHQSHSRQNHRSVPQSPAGSDSQLV